MKSIQITSQLFVKEANIQGFQIPQKSSNSSASMIGLEKPPFRFLLAPHMKTYHFIYSLRSSIRLTQEEALYLFVKGNKGAQLLKSGICFICFS